MLLNKIIAEQSDVWAYLYSFMISQSIPNVTCYFRKKGSDFKEKTKQLHSLSLIFQHTLNFIVHGFDTGGAEMDMYTVGSLADFLYKGRVGEVLNVIKNLASDGMTMAIVTHEMRFAQEVGKRILFMDEGLIVEQGTPEMLFTDPQNQRTKDFLKKVM